MQIVFIHPDLGIGGAERLVVDAALALKCKGHRVSFMTGHHDRQHCFEGKYHFLLFSIVFVVILLLLQTCNTFVEIGI